MKIAEKEPLCRLIALTGLAIRSYADQWLKNYDLTIEQLHVLKQIDQDTGKPQRNLGLLTDKSPANLTRILDRLEKKNWLVRRQSPQDRRSSLVFLTVDGELLLSQVKNLFDGLQGELLADIDPTEQQVALGVLQAIRKNIEKMSKY